MFSNKRAYAALARDAVGPWVVVALASALAVLAGGCSADVTRFDFPVFGLTDKGGETGSLPMPPEAMARRGYADPASGAPRGAGLGEAGRGVAPAPYASPPPASPGPGERFASVRDYDPPSPAGEPGPASERYAGRPMDRSRAAAPGETIQVQEGDTLYSIARRYGVSAAALIETNGLAHGATIKPGQQLVLPSAATSARALAEPATGGRAPLARTASPPLAAATPVPTAGWEGRHTLKPGESLYGIARQHGVTLAELQRVNGITEPTRVRAGTVLSVPGPSVPSVPGSAPAADLAPQRARSGAPGSAGQPRILNPPAVNPPAPEHKTAALADRSSDATEVAAEPGSASSRFRWPAHGRLIAAFGKRPDGTHNDGINIAVPQGTEIHAAESGRVAYAGDELKGYGNLVLIRHGNGWVSAYAHADQILVKRDDVVRRGQVIAKAGKTGTVDQPQLHFELRQGAKPVDPLPQLEK